LRISLSATDKCLARLRQDTNATSENTDLMSSQFQEQEMRVISKQSYHVLSHVFRSVKKFEDSGKCLDCIEMCIEDQKKYDELLYNKTFAKLSDMEKCSKINQTSSVFALEGPKRQDAEEIKARARLAKHKSKVGEMCERIYLAFSRIDLRQKSCITLTADDEQYIDRQFMAMVEYLKKLMNEGSDDSQCLSPTFRLVERAPDSDKMGEMFRLVLTSARLVSSRRFSVTNIEPQVYSDPYDVLIEAMPADTPNRITIYLDNLQATLMVAKTAYDNTDEQSIKLRTKLDHKAIAMGKNVAFILRNLSDIAHSKASKRIRSESTLFPAKDSHPYDFVPLFHNACDSFAKALSLYQGLEECSEQTIEWCDLLIEIIQQSRQTVFHNKKEDAYQARYHNVVAGTMAIKAYAESTCGSYGSALKTARGAWEQDGSDLGCLTTLFYCSMRHELFSNSDINNRNEKHTVSSFSNTFLELDHALDVYLSLSKLETSNVIQSLESLLSSFPVMCKMAMGHEMLIIGLQKRMIKLTIEIASKLLPSCNLEGSVEKNQTFTLFDLISSYLASFDDMLPQFMTCEKNQLSEELICLHNMIESTLKFLLKIRDTMKGNANGAEDDIAFHDVPSFLDDSVADDEQYSDEPHSLYDTAFVKSYIGGQNECLWIGKYFNPGNDL